MRRITKKIAAMGAAVVMAVSMMSIGASAQNVDSYNLRFTSGAPSSENVMSYSKILQASNLGRIRISSNYFYSLINGAYCFTICNNYASIPQNINTTGTYYVDYSGTLVPKANNSVSVSGTLMNYSVGKTVYASGVITV